MNTRARFGDVELLFGPRYRTSWAPTEDEINLMKEKNLLGIATACVIDQDGMFTITPILSIEGVK